MSAKKVMIHVTVGIVIATAIFLALTCMGCASTSGIYTSKTGEVIEVRSTRFLWQTEQIRISMQTNGLPEVEVNKTSADQDSITASAGAIGAMVGAGLKAAGAK